MNIHYEKAKALYRTINMNILEFGMEAMQAIDEEGQTLRQMSIELSGNTSLEDRLSRWVMAVRWLEVAREEPVYQEHGKRFSPSHLTEYWKLYERTDMETAIEVMNDTVIRNLRTIEVRPVEWVRAQGKPMAAYSFAEVCHKGWKYVASKWLPEAYSELERKGLLATRRDRRRVRLLKVVLSEFQAELQEIAQGAEVAS